jgi:hypothetical protein
MPKDITLLRIGTTLDRSPTRFTQWTVKIKVSKGLIVVSHEPFTLLFLIDTFLFFYSTWLGRIRPGTLGGSNEIVENLWRRV